jgi:hypothetical protein
MALKRPMRADDVAAANAAVAPSSAVRLLQLLRVDESLRF